MRVLNVLHRTRYRYARPVSFGEHQIMTRPRDSHDLRLLETRLTIAPTATLRWKHDVFGNSVAVAAFTEQGRELLVESRFRAEHYPLPPDDVTLEPYAQRYPFSYDAEEIPDLGRLTQRHYPDPEHAIDVWARGFVDAAQDSDTMAILRAMSDAIHQRFAYNARDEMGTQDPLETLHNRSGTCRDFALFLMEAARSLGFAARFVSGYLYDENRAGQGEGALLGSGATHAWVQIYLPGAGWVEFDPTNALVGGQDLIRVAVTRDPKQAAPISGTFTGASADYLGMTVEVEVRAEG
ncbi:MAG TPA: transglutaminase family protein [Acetobacteraceae bacterium]|jgi:transglutaminase-like putative cysteine protease